MADVDILNSALEPEYTAVWAHPPGEVLAEVMFLPAGKEFLAQEQEHADGLVTAAINAALGAGRSSPRPAMSTASRS